VSRTSASTSGQCSTNGSSRVRQSLGAVISDGSFPAVRTSAPSFGPCPLSSRPCRPCRAWSSLPSASSSARRSPASRRGCRPLRPSPATGLRAHVPMGRCNCRRWGDEIVAQQFTIGVRTVKAAVAEEASAARGVRAVGVSRGRSGRIDVFEVLVALAGTMVKIWMLVMRLMHSGRGLAWLSTRQDLSCPHCFDRPPSDGYDASSPPAGRAPRLVHQ
jgi:hypothetical protein